MSVTPPTPLAFTNIALSLSGGGYRAAAFHLGTLAMLERLQLLDQVRALSTVSGGTIVGAAYALSLAQGKTFPTFYAEFSDFLQNVNVIKTALARLRTSAHINQTHVMPSLIRAAAQVYDQELFGNETFEILLSEKCSRLKELAFNATDFGTGLSFRFQKSGSQQVSTGNNKASVSPEINRLIRLADIVAASSCFPSGFEPLRFPADFVWPQGQSLSAIRQQLGEKFAPDVPLMDGGVFDNQGIDSIKLILDRKDCKIELYIISDTTPRNGNIFAFPPHPRKKGLSLKWLYVLIWVLFVASLVTVGAIIGDALNTIANQNWNWLRGVFLYLIPLCFSLGVISLIICGRLLARDLKRRVQDHVGIELWGYVKPLTVPEVIELAGSRIQSLVVMASSIFMRRIRSLGYDKIFADEKFRKKLAPNLIYDLDNEEQWGRRIIDAGLQPSPQLRQVVPHAETFPTNLWFLNQKDLNNLISCGRATICFNVLKYLLRFRATEIKTAGSPEADLYERATRIWQELNR